MDKLLFLTNIPSPYRVDFLNELGMLVDLTVLFERADSDERDTSWLEYRFHNFRGVILKGCKASADTAFCPAVRKYLDKSWDHILCANAATPTGMFAIQTMKNRRIDYWIEGDGAFAKSGKGFKERVKKHFLSCAKGYFSTGAEHDRYYLTYGAEQDRIHRYPFSSIYLRDVLTEVPNEQEKHALRKALGISEERVVLSVGQMIRRKGFDILIQAAASCTDVGFYLIGGQPTKELEAMRHSTGSDNVHFIGFKRPEELKQYYRMADLFVLPTREDIWGLVVNEAMANGLPVITTDRCAAGLELVFLDGRPLSVAAGACQRW